MKNVFLTVNETDTDHCVAYVLFSSFVNFQRARQDPVSTSANLLFLIDNSSSAFLFSIVVLDFALF